VTEVRYYLDENLETEIAVQLKKRGIDAIHIRDLGLRGDTDEAHLERALTLKRILCTYDRDFLRLAKTGVQHAGIVIGERQRMTIGLWVKALTDLHANASAEKMENLVQFI
jgi:hypothetical protein